MLDGASRLDEIVEAAIKDEQPALGITDHGNMYGVLPFYRACKSQGIKPIIGTEAYMHMTHDMSDPKGDVEMLTTQVEIQIRGESFITI